MPTLVGVPADQARVVWPELEEKVAACLRKVDDHRWEPSDILDAIERRDMQLWITVDETSLVNMLITQLVNYPRCRECDLFMWIGCREEGWRDNLAIVENWAREQGCHYMSTHARPGSAKVVGYKKGLIHTYRGL